MKHPNCNKDRDCYNGEYCDLLEHKCFKELNAEYNEPCQRNGGIKYKFQDSKSAVCLHFFSLDCRGKLQCIASKCQTLGQSGDYCESDDQCRSNLFCYDRSNRGDGKCVKKKFPGMSCQLNSQCYNSICMKPQGNKPQQNVRTRRRR